MDKVASQGVGLLFFGKSIERYTTHWIYVLLHYFYLRQMFQRNNFQIRLKQERRLKAKKIRDLFKMMTIQNFYIKSIHLI